MWTLSADARKSPAKWMSTHFCQCPRAIIIDNDMTLREIYQCTLYSAWSAYVDIKGISFMMMTTMRRRLQVHRVQLWVDRLLPLLRVHPRETSLRQAHLPRLRDWHRGPPVQEQREWQLPLRTVVFLPGSRKFRPKYVYFKQRTPRTVPIRKREWKNIQDD